MLKISVGLRVLKKPTIDVLFLTNTNIYLHGQHSLSCLYWWTLIQPICHWGQN